MLIRIKCEITRIHAFGGAGLCNHRQRTLVRDHGTLPPNDTLILQLDDMNILELGIPTKVTQNEYHSEESHMRNRNLQDTS